MTKALGPNPSSPGRDVVAIDTGGTFTDLSAVLGDGTQVRLKVPSTPDDPGRAVLDAFDALRVQIKRPLGLAELRHGTTVATNALLERRGARVVLLTTAGFEDLLRLRRQDRPDLYALHPVVPSPLVAASDCLGVRERIGPDGVVVTELEDVAAFIQRNHELLRAADAIAICLLHSYADGTHERLLGDALTAAFPQTPITLSHAVAPVFREYERASTAAVNAYVAPVMSGYLRRLGEAVAPAPLRVQASAGGLVVAEVARREPVLTVLSGPAGGAAGAWQVGVRTGRSRLLAVDMGGTSTDVSVLDGGLVAEDDGRLDEHPLRIPLLPIDTVGAGGGSIAFVDAGGMLRVGPRSAGAVPGPACYGKAGPSAEPAVTDAHVVLGRISSLLGGAMALHPELAQEAVGRLADQLGRSVHDTAAAIVAIASANMARACKRVSMNRGIDPRGLTLVAFGGAGGLHACELADALDCPDVVFAGHGGVLSAEGIVFAAPQADHRRAVFETLVPGSSAAELYRVDALLHDHLAETRRKLAVEWPGIDASNAEVVGWADCRYVGQTYTLAVPIEAGISLPVAFAEHHQRRYGYALPDRRLELVSVRASARLRTGSQSTVVETDGTQHNGPVAISSYGATLWLPDGWQATGNEHGDFICTRRHHVDAARPATVDALHLAIHRNRVAAIAEQMGAVLMSAAFSANIKERRDFSCAIFDRDGRMVVHAAHIPVHLGSTPASVAAAIAAVPMKPGVHVVLNDPYAGGTHLPDVTVVSPVFIDAAGPGPAFYVANRAHHADVGGISPGSMPAPFDSAGKPRELTIHDEGIRLPPTVLDDDVLQRFADASRTPDERHGDLRAQVAANTAAQGWLRQLCDELGYDAVRGNNDALIRYAEARMRAVIAGIDDGIYRFEDALDDDGTSDVPVPIPVTLEIAGDEAIVDLRAAPDSGPGPLNAVRAIADSAVFYVFRAVAGAVSGEGGGAMPANAGLMRPISVCTRAGSVLDARYPAAVSSGNVETSQRLVDALFGAMAQAVPDAVPAASCGSMNNVLLGGQQPAPWVHYETLAGGAGAGPLGGGADAIHCHMTNTLNTPVEAMERAFPLRIDSYAVRAKSDLDHDEAADHRGGSGVVRAYRFLAPAEVTLVTERRRLAPWSRGCEVGGQRGMNRLVRADGTVVDLPGKCTVAVGIGDVLEICTPGGGHFRHDNKPLPES